VLRKAQHHPHNFIRHFVRRVTAPRTHRIGSSKNDPDHRAPSAPWLAAPIVKLDYSLIESLAKVVRNRKARVGHSRSAAAAARLPLTQGCEQQERVAPREGTPTPAVRRGLGDQVTTIGVLSLIAIMSGLPGRSLTGRDRFNGGVGTSTRHGPVRLPGVGGGSTESFPASIPHPTEGAHWVAFV
jgi:hypothetical protein